MGNHDVFGSLWAEDLWFVKCVSRLKGKLPSTSEMLAFSVETVFHPNPLGVHKPWAFIGRFISAKEYQALTHTCPVLVEIESAEDRPT